MSLVKTMNFGRSKTSTPVTDSGLVAYYKLDGDANDSTPNLHNGVATSVSYVSGKIGQAANFNSDTSVIKINDTIDLSFTNGTIDTPFSISMWIYVTQFSSVGNWILNKRGLTTNEWQLVCLSGKMHFAKFSNNSSSIYQGITCVSSIPLNSWQHIAYTDDGSGLNSGQNFYINGVRQLVSSANAGTYVKMQDTLAQTGIGLQLFDGVAANLRHRGYVDEIGIWKNRILTASEVLNLYNNGSGKTYPF